MGELWNVYLHCSNILWSLINLQGSRGWTNPNQCDKKEYSSVIVWIRLTYEVWRNKLDMQKVVLWVPKDKQGIIVLLGSITDNKKGEKVVSTLTAHNLHSKNGLKRL